MEMTDKNKILHDILIIHKESSQTYANVTIEGKKSTIYTPEIKIKPKEENTNKYTAIIHEKLQDNLKVPLDKYVENKAKGTVKIKCKQLVDYKTLLK